MAALNQGGKALIASVSCASPGNCSAGGYYTGTFNPNSGSEQAFVVTEAHGSWGTAREVPGTAALNQGGFAELSSVSCASAGSCSAGGSNCVEVGTVWCKSSYSGNGGGNCVEVARNLPRTVAVRDSKDPRGPVLTIESAGWRGFIADVKAGRHDLA